MCLGQILTGHAREEGMDLSFDRNDALDTWGGSGVERLPSAQGVTLGPGIESHVRLLTGSLRLPLPVSLLLSESLMNK